MIQKSIKKFDLEDLKEIQKTLDKRTEFGPDHALGYIIGWIESKYRKRDFAYIQETSSKMIESKRSKVAQGYIDQFMESNTAQEITKQLILNQMGPVRFVRKPEHKLKEKEPSNPENYIIQSLRCNKSGLSIRNLSGFIDIQYKHKFSESILKKCLGILIQNEIVNLRERNGMKFYCISKDHLGDVQFMTGNIDG